MNEHHGDDPRPLRHPGIVVLGDDEHSETIVSTEHAITITNAHVVVIDSTDHPLALALQLDGTVEPGTEPVTLLTIMGPDGVARLTGGLQRGLGCMAQLQLRRWMGYPPTGDDHGPPGLR